MCVVCVCLFVWRMCMCAHVHHTKVVIGVAIEHHATELHQREVLVRPHLHAYTHVHEKANTHIMHINLHTTHTPMHIMHIHLFMRPYTQSIHVHTHATAWVPW